MKPRIYKRNGLWYCRVIWGALGFGPEGIGYSPFGAYEDWRNHA
jgi:hypothetical protein